MLIDTEYVVLAQFIRELFETTYSVSMGDWVVSRCHVVVPAFWGSATRHCGSSGSFATCAVRPIFQLLFLSSLFSIDNGEKRATNVYPGIPHHSRAVRSRFVLSGTAHLLPPIWLVGCSISHIYIWRILDNYAHISVNYFGSVLNVCVLHLYFGLCTLTAWVAVVTANLDEVCWSRLQWQGWNVA